MITIIHLFSRLKREFYSSLKGGARLAQVRVGHYVYLQVIDNYIEKRGPVCGIW